ncbi:ATP-binding cassette domain-containing protein [Patescibacteria group bacterium]
MTKIVEVNNLTKKFKDLVAVDNVSFDVEAGTNFAFLGPNGAGKTTTIHMLATLLAPTSGTAKINGFDISKDRDKVRSSIGLTFQDPSLDDSLTAWENLKYHARFYDVPKIKFEKRAEEVLNMVELWDRRKDVVKKFSGGMRRRLEIARSLLHYPKLLFLDEPTLGLDPQTRNKIWEYLDKLRSEREITLFMTTHYMQEAEQADQVAIIDNGKIIANNTPADLKKKHIGGDLFYINTANNEQTVKELEKEFCCEVRQDKKDRIVFTVPDSTAALPKIDTTITADLLSLELHQPTLEDVFLKLTGREIREEDASQAEMNKRHLRTRRRGPH